MRNPKRIPRILKTIEKFWAKYPDQRLGQLLRNYGYGNDANLIFNIEDDDLEKRLKSNLKLLSRPFFRKGCLVTLPKHFTYGGRKFKVLRYSKKYGYTLRFMDGKEKGEPIQYFAENELVPVGILEFLKKRLM
jgi:hypothetical protein